VEAVSATTERPGRGQARTAGGKAQTAARQPGDEPEVLEGLARDIVSRLATTLFAEDDAPVRQGEETGEEPGGHLRLGQDVSGHDPIPAGMAGKTLKATQAANDQVPAGARGPRRVREPESDRPALLVRGTIRSGRQVRHGGDVVVLGDVNPGGQIVAAGDVAVMGALRGTVHAGATGDQSAVVIAFRLYPTQLRIASYVSRPPEDPGGRPDYPEMALVRDGVVIVQAMTAGALTRSSPDETLPDATSGRRSPLIGKQ
jgi:septum site-determining protein MinC